MINALLKGIAISLLLVFSVGPVIFTVIKQSINNGRDGGFSFVAGVWLSDLLMVVLSNAFSELVTQMLDYKKTIGFTGSAFLIGMGLFYLFFKKVKMQNEAEEIKVIELDLKYSSAPLSPILLYGGLPALGIKSQSLFDCPLYIVSLFDSSKRS